MNVLINMRIENIRIILIEKTLNFVPNAIIARQQSSKNINTGIAIDLLKQNELKLSHTISLRGSKNGVKK